MPSSLKDSLTSTNQHMIQNIWCMPSKLIDFARDFFEDRIKGGFFLTSKDGEKLLTRPKEIYDGAIPSGNSIMAMNLARIWKITGDEGLSGLFKPCFSAFSGFLKTHPSGAENFACSRICPSPTLRDRDCMAIYKKFQLSPFSRGNKKSVSSLQNIAFIYLNKTNPELIVLAPYLGAFAKVKEPTFFSLPGL